MKLSFLMKYRCVSFNDLYTAHSGVFRTMVSENYGRIMLIGEPGTGKSTIVEVLLNEIYLGKNRSESVLRISTLLDQGIQFIRTDVKTFCQTCSGKTQKTLVLDDFDTLPDSNQRVFLNYMDSYPSIHFIVTATSPSKLTDGLDSRLILFKLAPFPRAFLRSEAERIAVAERIPYEAAALDILVLHCGSSVRTMLNAMEKLCLLGGATESNVLANCIHIDMHALGKFTRLVEKMQELDAIDILYGIYESGFSVMDILDTYFTFIKTTEMEEERKYAFLKIVAKYITIFNTVHEHGIELLFFVHQLCELKISVPVMSDCADTVP